MKSFSLIVPTVHRTVELERLLGSLEGQEEPFQVIIIDQNADGRVSPIIERFRPKLDIVHKVVPFRGAARARNAGLAVSTADIIAFPDDDCWYPRGLLQHVRELLLPDTGFGGVCVRGVDPEGRDAGIRWAKRPAATDRLNIWRTSIEWSMFLCQSAVGGLRFNEEIGPGAGTPWGAGEGTDFLLRVLSQGHRVRYEPRLFVHHPSHPNNPDREERGLSYARGLGRVLRLNGYPTALAAMLCFGPLIRMVAYSASLDSKGAGLALRVATHRWAGFRARP